jgi:hypothetical protein
MLHTDSFLFGFCCGAAAIVAAIVVLSLTGVI